MFSAPAHRETDLTEAKGCKFPRSYIFTWITSIISSISVFTCITSSFLLLQNRKKGGHLEPRDPLAQYAGYNKTQNSNVRNSKHINRKTSFQIKVKQLAPRWDPVYACKTDLESEEEWVMNTGINNQEEKWPKARWQLTTTWKVSCFASMPKRRGGGGSHEVKKMYVVDKS